MKEDIFKDIVVYFFNQYAQQKSVNGYDMNEGLREIKSSVKNILMNFFIIPNEF